MHLIPHCVHISPKIQRWLPHSAHVDRPFTLTLSARSSGKLNPQQPSLGRLVPIGEFRREEATTRVTKLGRVTGHASPVWEKRAGTKSGQSPLLHVVYTTVSFDLCFLSCLVVMEGWTLEG